MRLEYFAVHDARVLRFVDEVADDGEVLDRGYATVSEHATPDEARIECQRLQASLPRVSTQPSV